MRSIQNFFLENFKILGELARFEFQNILNKISKEIVWFPHKNLYGNHTISLKIYFQNYWNFQPWKFDIIYKTYNFFHQFIFLHKTKTSFQSFTSTFGLFNLSNLIATILQITRTNLVWLIHLNTISWLLRSRLITFFPRFFFRWAHNIVLWWTNQHSSMSKLNRSANNKVLSRLARSSRKKKKNLEKREVE